MLCTEAARLRTDDDIHDLRRLIDKMSAAVTDPAAFLRANWALHRRIAKIVQNRVLASFYDALSDFIEASFEEVVNPTDEVGYKQSRLQIHIDLVEAIAAGNKAAVARAIRRHTLESAPKRTTNSRAVKSTKARHRDLPDA
jgi:DNA-binding FadR family transcriptional regulator